MIELNGQNLGINDLRTIARSSTRISIPPEANARMEAAYKSVLSMADEGKPIYGINTGFGIFSNKKISLEESKQLNRNLIFSHAIATDRAFPEEIVRAAMAVRINTLAKGLSGINPVIVEKLVDMLNKGLTPLIASKGSMGSSGDLCMLAQLGLVLIKDENDCDEDSGQATFKNRLISGKQAMNMAGIERVAFSHKDGLALINGATFSAAITALCAADMNELITLANASAALSLEAMCGRSGAFNQGIHQARGILGQIDAAEKINFLINGSTFIDSLGQIQDAYSLRCAPQVHGAVKETARFVADIVEKEINAATDNPLLIDNRMVSGGNFHGEPIALIADFLSIAASELGSISERRIFRLLDKNLNNGLPQMLVDTSIGEGINSGVMILQYTAASLALENQTLASPDSVRSLPTSANQEDHNANASNAALHLWEIIQNTTKIIAIELYTAARAVDQRKMIDPAGKLGVGTEKIFELIRSEYPYQVQDIQWRKDLEPFFSQLLKGGEFKRNFLSIVN